MKILPPIKWIVVRKVGGIEKQFYGDTFQNACMLAGIKEGDKFLYARYERWGEMMRGRIVKGKMTRHVYDRTHRL